MAAVVIIAAYEILAAIGSLFFGITSKDQVTIGISIAAGVLIIAIAVGLIFRNNLARIVRIVIAAISIVFSGFLGFWAPYSPFFAARYVLPGDFFFPTWDALTILYSIFVIWILTRPSTVRLFKRR